jgi:lysophospholipase L1-like esterase
VGRTPRISLPAVAALVVALVAVDGAAAASLPKKMAATGDSITRAYNTGWFPYTDNPAASWSTGTDSRVRSHLQRLIELSPSGKVTGYNDARSGAKMAALANQMASAVSQRVDYVTVLMGANDVCTSTEASMTTVGNFTAQFSQAMETVTTGLPRATVYVVSIPDIYHLWEIYKDDATARYVWGLLGICQSMLANASSTDPVDVERRARVKQRNIDFNHALEAVCAQYRQCVFDGHAAFQVRFVRSDVSSRDYFHPSLAGQAKLAEVSWANGPWAP